MNRSIRCTACGAACALVGLLLVDAQEALALEPGQCGAPGAGDCFTAHGTPFCNDNCGAEGPCPGCCDTICAFDPFCCNVSWDDFCVNEAMEFCGCQPEQVPTNDDCINAIPVGLCDTPFSNTCATQGGPSHAACNDGFLLGLGPDIWYRYTAGFTGDLLVSLCQGTDYDTQLAVYETINGTAECNTLSNPPLGCNDDGPTCPPLSEVVVQVQQSRIYIIRIGGSYLEPTGSGTLTLSTDVPVCPEDLDGDCVIGFSDLTVLLSRWGAAPGNPADFDGDGVVGFSDLVALLAAWGAC